ncbi:MAG: NfeD family protein [Deltaproteobacteria bacterium]|nr:NfeD family protein [Deltaproteobacteria bacterium]
MAHNPPSGKASRGTILRYALFQVPGWLLVGAGLWALRHWFAADPAVLAAIAAFWLAKDFVLYFFTWKAYQPPGETAHPMAGAKGFAATDIDPEGRVRIRHETWQARTAPGAPFIPGGTPIRVAAAKGLTLIVEEDERKEG